jgi:hypothetical protein
MFTQIGSLSKILINYIVVKKIDTAADRSAHPHALDTNEIISHRKYRKAGSIKK